MQNLGMQKVNECLDAIYGVISGEYYCDCEILSKHLREFCSCIKKCKEPPQHVDQADVDKLYRGFGSILNDAISTIEETARKLAREGNRPVARGVFDSAATVCNSISRNFKSLAPIYCRVKEQGLCPTKLDRLRKLSLSARKVLEELVDYRNRP